MKHISHTSKKADIHTYTLSYTQAIAWPSSFPPRDLSLRRRKQNSLNQSPPYMACQLWSRSPKRPHDLSDLRLIPSTQGRKQKSVPRRGGNEARLSLVRLIFSLHYLLLCNKLSQTFQLKTFYYVCFIDLGFAFRQGAVGWFIGSVQYQSRSPDGSPRALKLL